jgi:hypothetical protein
MIEVTDDRQEELARLENLVSWCGAVDRAFTSSLSRRTTSVDSRIAASPSPTPMVAAIARSRALCSA